MIQVSRRRFIKNAGGAGIALWLGINVRGNTIITTNIVESGNFTPYILVESGGGITIFNTKPEMGQGTFQSIPAIIAEEFEVSLDQVTIKVQTEKNHLAIGNAPEVPLLDRGPTTQIYEKSRCFC